MTRRSVEGLVVSKSERAIARVAFWQKHARQTRARAFLSVPLFVCSLCSFADWSGWLTGPTTLSYFELVLLGIAPALLGLWIFRWTIRYSTTFEGHADRARQRLASSPETSLMRSAPHLARMTPVSQVNIFGRYTMSAMVFGGFVASGAFAMLMAGFIILGVGELCVPGVLGASEAPEIAMAIVMILTGMVGLPGGLYGGSMALKSMQGLTKEQDSLVELRVRLNKADTQSGTLQLMDRVGGQLSLERQPEALTHVPQSSGQTIE